MTCAGPDIDVPVATVTGSFTVGGAAVPSTTAGALIVLYVTRDANSTDVATLGYTGQGTYTVRIVPGTYDLLYLGTGTNDSIHPSNPRFRLRTVVIPPGSSTLDIDVPVATVTGSFTVGGAAVTSMSSSARVWLQSAMWGDAPPLADTGQSTYTARLVAGTYDLYYAHDTSDRTGSTLPFNSKARLRTDVVIPPGSSSLDIDVPIADVTGSFTVGGAALPATSSGARISLQNTTTGDGATIGYTGRGPYAARVVPGTYDVQYAFDPTPGNTLPSNSNARIRTGVIIPPGSSSLDIDIPVATVTGSLTVDGAPFSSTTDVAGIGLANAARTDHAGLGEVGRSTYTVRLVPGTYDAYYGSSRPGATLPINDHALFRTGIVIPPGNSSLDIDVPVATVTGSLTVGGVAVPSTINDGRIYIRGATTGMAWSGYTGQTAYIGETTYNIRVVPGTYDIDYVFGGSTGSPLPISSRRIRTGVVIPPGSSSLDIDVPVATVTGSFTIGGIAMPSTNNESGFTVRDPTTGMLTTLGFTGQTTYTARLVPGTYDVFYRNPRPNPALPINLSAQLRCFVVP